MTNDIVTPFTGKRREGKKMISEEFNSIIGLTQFKLGSGGEIGSQLSA